MAAVVRGIGSAGRRGRGFVSVDSVSGQRFPGGQSPVERSRGSDPSNDSNGWRISGHVWTLCVWRVGGEESPNSQVIIEPHVVSEK